MIESRVKATALLLCLAAFFFGPIHAQECQEDTLQQLLSTHPGRGVGNEGKIRAALNPDSVAKILDGARTLSTLQTRRLASILSSGGPWMPAVISSLDKSGSPAELAERVLLAALEQRPILRELPPPGAAATTMLDPFGNNMHREGIALMFPGTWPEEVGIGEFLDRINETARPTHPFVLHPELGGDPAFILEEAALEGAASMVLERILSRFGLGVTYLESVAMVERGGGGIQDQFGTDQESDARLLEPALKILSDGSACDGARAAAYKALAYLDLPGLFEGYYQELEQGKTVPALDVLLYGPQRMRLSATMIEKRNRSVLELLFRTLHDLDRIVCDDEERPARGSSFTGPRRQFSRFLLDIRRDAYYRIMDMKYEALPAARVQALLDAQVPSGMLAGLRLILIHAPMNPGAGYVLIERICRWPTSHPAIIRLVESCLREALAGPVSDEQLVRLLLNPATRTAGLELASSSESRSALDALIRLIRSGSTDDLKAVHCAAGLVQRLGCIDEGKEVAATFVDSDLPRRARAVLAGLALALDSDPEGEAPDFLIRFIAAGGDPGRVAARMLSLLDGRKMQSYLEPLRRAAKGSSPELLEELEKAILRSAGGDNVYASRLRLAIRAQEPEGIWKELDTGLALLERMDCAETFRVAVDF